MPRQKFSIIKRIKSFAFAFNGLKTLIKEEQNSWVHIFAAVCTIIAGFIFKLSTYEWIAIIFAIGNVFAFELVNSSLENICNFVSPEKHEMVKKIKDLAAAAVLISAITALIIGLIVFLPKILKVC